MFASHAVQLNLSGGGGTGWSQPPASCNLLPFSVYEVIRVVFLLRSWLTTTRQTSHVNDFVNVKSHAKEKPLLAGYFFDWMISSNKE